MATRPYALCIYFLFNLLILALTVFSWFEGDPSRLLHGTDVNGELCQGSAGFTYFPKPRNSTAVTLCLDGCPLTAAQEAICSDNEEYECYDSYPSKPYLNDYCLPAEADYREAVLRRLYRTEDVITRIVGDVYRVTIGENAMIIGLAAMMGFAVLIIFGFIILCSAKGKKRPIWYFYYFCLFSLLALTTKLCHCLYSESVRASDQVCSDFSIVHMLSCSEEDRFSFYRVLCWVLASFFLCLLLVAGCLAEKKHKGLLALHYGVQVIVHTKWLWCVVIFAYGIGVGIYYTCVGILVYQASYWAKNLGPANVELHGSVREFEFSLHTRALTFITLLYAFVSLYFVARVVRKVVKRMVRAKLIPSKRLGRIFHYSVAEKALRSSFMFIRSFREWRTERAKIMNEGEQKESMKNLRKLPLEPVRSVLWVIQLFLTLLLPTFVSLFEFPPSIASSIVPVACAWPLSFLLSQVLAALLEGMVSGSLSVLGHMEEEKEEVSRETIKNMQLTFKNCVPKEFWEIRKVLNKDHSVSILVAQFMLP